MLRKLMKHELRATARVMGPMLLLTLAAAVGGNIAVYYLVESEAAVLNLIGVFLLSGTVVKLVKNYFSGDEYIPYHEQAKMLRRDK